MFAVCWCIGAEPSEMNVHGAAGLPGTEPDPRRGQVDPHGGHSLKLRGSCGCVKFGPWTEHAITARDSLEALKTGENKVFLSLLFLINAVLFKLHQYLLCNKASQCVDILFRATAAFSEAISQ